MVAGRVSISKYDMKQKHWAEGASCKIVLVNVNIWLAEERDRTELDSRIGAPR